MATHIRGGKKKFVADGVFYAVLNAILTKELAEYGDSGAEVRVTKKEEVVTEIPKKEETSPATGGSVAGVREKVSPKTKQ